MEVCEQQAWGLHQCSSKTIPAVFRTVRNREGLTISKELLSTEEPIYYYSYSLTLEGNFATATSTNLFVLKWAQQEQVRVQTWHPPPAPWAPKWSQCCLIKRDKWWQLNFHRCFGYNQSNNTWVSPRVTAITVKWFWTINVKFKIIIIKNWRLSLKNCTQHFNDYFIEILKSLSNINFFPTCIKCFSEVKIFFDFRHLEIKFSN